MAVLAISAPAMAQETSAADEILVTAQRNNRTEVTAGGNVGLFGTKAAEAVPFNIRRDNEALILNQQPDTLGEGQEHEQTVRTPTGNRQRAVDGQSASVVVDQEGTGIK